MKRTITANEDQILQVLRQMKPMDRLTVIRKGERSDAEWEVQTGRVQFLMRESIDTDSSL